MEEKDLDGAEWPLIVLNPFGVAERIMGVQDGFLLVDRLEQTGAPKNRRTLARKGVPMTALKSYKLPPDPAAAWEKIDAQIREDQTGYEMHALLLAMGVRDLVTVKSLVAEEIRQRVRADAGVVITYAEITAFLFALRSTRRDLFWMAAVPQDGALDRDSWDRLKS